MAGVVSRYFSGMILYGVGLLLSGLVVPVVLLRALFGGPKGIIGLFKRGKHDVEPESKFGNFITRFVVTILG